MRSIAVLLLVVTASFAVGCGARVVTVSRSLPAVVQKELAHVSRVWIAGFLTGGRSEIDGERSNDLQQNWRVGGTLAIPMGRMHSLKFSASSGVSARTGNNFDAFGVAWQYRWGGGL